MTTFDDLTRRHLDNIARCICGAWTWLPTGFCACGHRWNTAPHQPETQAS